MSEIYFNEQPERYIPISVIEQIKAEKVIKMRDVTPEEQKLIDGYIKSISKPTGVDFWELEQQPCPNAISRSDMLDAIGHGTTYTSEDLQIIIKGLPSVNPQPCEDAISRQAVIDAIDKWVKDKHILVTLPTDEVTPLFENVHALPSVNPQLKTGHWIKTGYIDKVMCSICNRKMWNFWEVNDFVHCPQCGAKMVDPQESEGKE